MTQNGRKIAWKEVQHANKAWWRDVKIYIQKQRRTMESEMQENGGASLQCILPLKAKTGPGVKPSWTE